MSARFHVCAKCKADRQSVSHDGAVVRTVVPLSLGEVVVAHAAEHPELAVLRGAAFLPVGFAILAAAVAHAALGAVITRARAFGVAAVASIGRKGGMSGGRGGVGVKTTHESTQCTCLDRKRKRKKYRLVSVFFLLLSLRLGSKEASGHLRSFSTGGGRKLCTSSGWARSARTAAIYTPTKLQ